MIKISFLTLGIGDEQKENIVDIWKKKLKTDNESKELHKSFLERVFTSQVAHLMQVATTVVSLQNIRTELFVGVIYFLH